MVKNLSSPEICILGAGFAGLTAAIQIRRLLNWNSFTIYEKNVEIGGAWFSNTYPGAECDFPSHFYSLSFEPNPNWSRNYAPQAEILDYMKNVAVKYKLYENLKLRTEVESVTWDDNAYKWRLISKDLQTGRRDERTFDFVFSGVNFLWQPNVPKEFEAFGGPCIHTAEWDHALNLEGKVVGVVGSGSSAVQIIPAIASQVGFLHSFQRHASWVLPKDVYDFSALTKWAFRNVPLVMKLYRWFTFWSIDLMAKAGIHGSKMAKQVTEFATKGIRDQCKGNADLFQEVMPKNAFGCNVFSLSSTYIPTLASPKVKLHSSRISRVTSDGIVDMDGSETKLDVLILATGFKSQEYFGPMRILGLDEKDVCQVWKNDRPKNYLGIFTPLAPNLFFIGGPYGIIGTSTAIFMYECQVEYVIHMLRHMLAQNVRCVVLERAVEEAWMAELDEAYSKHVLMSEDCDSWLKNSKGFVTTGAPFTAFQYWQKYRKVDFSKFSFLK